MVVSALLGSRPVSCVEWPVRRWPYAAQYERLFFLSLRYVLDKRCSLGGCRKWRRKAVGRGTLIPIYFDDYM